MRDILLGTNEFNCNLCKCKNCGINLKNCDKTINGYANCLSCDGTVDSCNKKKIR